MRPSDEELLRSSDASDFGLFYERYVSSVTAYVARRTRLSDVVFDIVAETFARALAHRDQYDTQRGPAVAWLFGIARYLMLDAASLGRVQDDARRRLGMATIAIDDAQLAAVEARGQLDLSSTLSCLPQEQREAVVRRVLAEQPYPAIAHALGCSEPAVRKRVSRGLALLRRELKDTP